MRGARALAIPISPSCPLRPSFIRSITTVHQPHKHSVTVIQARHKYQSLDERYQKNAVKYWDNFYKRHGNKFFKDRHYLEKDWGEYFSDGNPSRNGKVVLEVGCGAGNTIFPLVAAYPKLYVHACDFSHHAIAFVKSHVDFKEDQNIKRVLKPNGYVLLRDYAVGDFAQFKLQERSQMISEDFYVRGDGTCSFYFSEDFLSNLFLRAGFKTVDINIYCKKVENRLRDVTMDRRWIRAIFNSSDCSCLDSALIQEGR